MSTASERVLFVRSCMDVAAMFLVGGVCFVCLTGFGCVSQTEFSPDRMVFRDTIHFLHPLLSSPAKEWSTPLLDRFRKLDDGRTPAVAPPRWIFSHDKSWRSRSSGDARFAYRLFRNDSWLEWSDRHPDLARQLWPKIIPLLREEKYNTLLVVLVFAQDANTHEDLDLAFAEAAKE